MTWLDDGTRQRFPLAAALLDAMDEEVRARRATAGEVGAQADPEAPAALMDAFRRMLPVGLQTEARGDASLSRLEQMVKVLCDVVWTDLVLPLLDMLLLPAKSSSERSPLGTEWRRRLVYETLGLPFTAGEGSGFPLAAHDHEQYSHRMIARAIGRVEVFKCLFASRKDCVATLEDTRRRNAEALRLDTAEDHGEGDRSSIPLLSRHHHRQPPARLLAPTVYRPEGRLRMTLGFGAPPDLAESAARPRPDLAESAARPRWNGLNEGQHADEIKRVEWCRQWRDTRDAVWEWARRLCPAGIECRIVGECGDEGRPESMTPLAELTPDRESIIARFKWLSRSLAAGEGDRADADHEIESLRIGLREADTGGRVLDWGFRLAGATNASQTESSS